MAMSYEERMALIKKVAERRKRLDKQAAALEEKSRVARREAIRERSKPRSKLESDIREEYNVNQWTDQRQYAEQYYGDVKYQTERFDNDWD